MVKFLLPLFFLLTNCVLDTKNNVFKNNKINKNEIVEFSYDLSFLEYKKNIIKYGKISKYPKLDK